VIRGDKVQHELNASRAAASAFLHDYGIDTVVVETGPLSCNSTVDDRLPGMILTGEIPVLWENGERKGTILVYRHINVSRTPKSALTLPSEIVKGGIKIEF
jgi:hypothetical protein